MSPLADPVIGAIFANADVAGLAAESLIRVTLEADNKRSLAGKDAGCHMHKYIELQHTRGQQGSIAAV